MGHEEMNGAGGRRARHRRHLRRAQHWWASPQSSALDGLHEDGKVGESFGIEREALAAARSTFLASRGGALTLRLVVGAGAAATQRVSSGRVVARPQHGHHSSVRSAAVDLVEERVRPHPLYDDSTARLEPVDVRRCLWHPNPRARPRGSGAPSAPEPRRPYLQRQGVGAWQALPVQRPSATSVSSSPKASR